MQDRPRVLIVGAGPIGLEVAWELKRRGIPYLQIDRAQIGSTISWFPEQATFFSSSERIGIGGTTESAGRAGKWLNRARPYLSVSGSSSDPWRSD